MGLLVFRVPSNAT
jgi:hypothetical protein